MKILQIKPLKVEELREIVEFDRLCFGGLWNKEGYKREIPSPNSSLLVLSYPKICASENFELGEKIVGLGCLWAILEEAHITILGIHPDYQGQGLGQFLLYSMLRDARSRKLERATLEVGVWNLAALSLYQKFGFKIAGRRRGYYQKTGEDALILWHGNLHKPEFGEKLGIWQEQIGKNLANNNWKIGNWE